MVQASEETAKKLCEKDANLGKLFRQAKFTTQLKSPHSGKLGFMHLTEEVSIYFT